MEDGTQNGGHYGCPGCDGNINSSYDLEYSFQRINFFNKKPFQKKKNYYKRVHQERKTAQTLSKTLKLKNSEKSYKRGVWIVQKKDDMQKDLAEVLGGTVRLPALLSNKKICG